MKIQIALDYMLVFTFVLFIFLIVFASVAKQRVLISEQQTFSQLQLVAQTVATEINSASQAGNGYYAVIPLPPQLSIIAYSISVTKQGMVIASSNILGQYIQATAFSSVPGVYSNANYLSPNKLSYNIPTVYSSGYITFQNTYGTICIDFSCPLTTNQSGQLNINAKAARSLVLNGLTSNAVLSSPVTSSSSQSISFWVKPSVTSSLDQYIVDQGTAITPNNNWIALLNGQVIGGPTGLLSCGSTVALTPNNWYMVTYVVNTIASSQFMSIYINGNQSMGCGPRSIGGGSTPVTFNIGQEATASKFTLFNGSLSNMQVYSAGLTSNQVLSLYSEGVSGQPVMTSNVAAWYPFGGDTNDYSGNGHNLLVNAQQYYPAFAQITAQVYNTSGISLRSVPVGFITDSGNFLSNQAYYASASSNGLAQAFLNQGVLSTVAQVKAVAFNGNLSTSGNLIAWWPLVEGEGMIAHDVMQKANTANTLNGNIVNAYWSLPSSALSFDGSTSVIQIPNGVPMQTYPISISAWVNFASQPNFQSQYLFSRSGQWQIGACTQNLLVCVYNPTSSTAYYSNSIITPGQWYMLTAVINSGAPGNVTMYLNGVQVLSGAQVAETSTFNSIQVGYASRGTSSYYFNGSMTNLQIYKYAMTSQDVASLFRQGIGSGPYPATIAAWYPLNGNSNDYSGNGYNAIAYGGIGLSQISLGSATVQQPQLFAGSFNGISSSVLVPSNAMMPSTNVFVSAWIKSPSTSAATEPIVFAGTGPTDNNGYELEVTSRYASFTVKPVGQIWGTCQVVLSSGATLNNNQVHFIAGQYNGTYITLYVDGAQVSQKFCQSPSAPLSYGASPQGYIGANPSQLYTGLISDVQVYNGIFTPSQIFRMYQENIGGLPFQGYGLVGWWPLNGNTNDYSALNNTSYNFNVIFQQPLASLSSFSPSLNGAGLVFNGTGNCNCNVIVPGSATISGQFTISAWISPGRPLGKENIVGMQNGFRLGLDWMGSNELDFYANTGGAGLSGPATTLYPVNYNQWTMVTGVYNGVAMSLYQNGLPVNTMLMAGSTPTESSPVVLGATEIPTFNNYFFNGTIADVQLYNGQLTAPQIYQLYNAGAPPTSSATVSLGASP